MAVKLGAAQNMLASILYKRMCVYIYIYILFVYTYIYTCIFICTYYIGLL